MIEHGLWFKHGLVDVESLRFQRGGKWEFITLEHSISIKYINLIEMLMAT